MATEFNLLSLVLLILSNITDVYSNHSIRAFTYVKQQLIIHNLGEHERPNVLLLGGSYECGAGTMKDREGYHNGIICLNMISQGFEDYGIGLTDDELAVDCDFNDENQMKQLSFIFNNTFDYILFDWAVIQYTKLWGDEIIASIHRMLTNNGQFIWELDNCTCKFIETNKQWANSCWMELNQFQRNTEQLAEYDVKELMFYKFLSLYSDLSIHQKEVDLWMSAMRQYIDKSNALLLKKYFRNVSVVPDYHYPVALRPKHNCYSEHEHETLCKFVLIASNKKELYHT
eukprot:17118_1